MIDRETADRIFDELAALREGVSDVHAVAARVEERVGAFMTHADERGRKHSDRLKALEEETATVVQVREVDTRLKSIEVWRWVLVGAWLAVPVSWVVFGYIRR